MEIVKNHYIPGAKVESFNQIKDIAFRMIEILNKGLVLNGIVTDGYGLAHNQVEDKEPLSFFVLSDNTLRTQNWPSQFIINPEIIKAERTINLGKINKGENNEYDDVRSNIIKYQESCFSFPFKAPKTVERFFSIRVVYYIPGNTKGIFKLLRKKLIRVEETLEGLKAHIFQHEEQHCRGKNIYF